MMEGILAIQDGLNPKLIEEKLRAYVTRPNTAPRTMPRRAA